MPNEKSEALFEQAMRVAPSGVHSDFRRAFPRFFESADGSKIRDVDGNEFIDYHLAFGAILLGHRNRKTIEAVRAQLERGDLWGMGSHMLELEVAEKICRYVPSSEKVRFSNSGSESSYNAVRLARSFTGRRKIVKFEGSYHGWHDYVDVGVFPQREDLGRPVPNSSGMLKEALEHTLVTEYNNVDKLRKVLKENAGDVAAVIVEPILHSCGCILPEDGFLESLRELTARENIVLIFDEVITGFRHSLGGVQSLFGVKPDLTIFAKAMGNGFPIGAVCGDREIMDEIQPGGGAHVAGTFCGHPVSLAAVRANIEQLEDKSSYDRLESSGEYLRSELSKAIREEKVGAQVKGFKSIFAVYFTEAALRNYADLKINNDDKMFASYCSSMHRQGIFLAPQAYKRSHISVAHSRDDLEKTMGAARVALAEAKRAGR